MRLITPLKCSASLVLQHQVLPQKTGEKEAQKFLVAVCLMCPHVGDKEDASACGRSPNPLQRHCGQQRFASWWLHVRPSHMENKQKVKTTLSLDLVSSVSSCLTFMESSSSCLLPWMLFFFFSLSHVLFILFLLLLSDGNSSSEMMAPSEHSHCPQTSSI